MARSTEGRRKRGWWSQRSGGQQVTIVAAAMSACAAIIAAVIGLQGHAPTVNVYTSPSASPSGNGAHSTRPSAAASGTTTPVASGTTGTITWPPDGYTRVKHDTTLLARGTVTNLQPGHQLLLFLNFANENKYYGGDPEPPITLTTGAWSEHIFVGGNKQPGQEFNLYLVDLGPQDRQLIDNQANPGWASGFPPSVLSGSGEQVLDSVTFTTD